MLGFCADPSPDQNVAAFERLVAEAFRLRNERRIEQDQELLSRRRAARAVPHKDVQEGATPSAGIIVNMDRELDQASSAVSKAAGARKGLECESSAIRQQDASRLAS